MRTSNKLLITAFALILIALIGYDFTLKQSYLSGAYKDQFREYINLNYKDFDEIELNASTAANIILQQGPFSVKMEPTATRFVKLSQKGGALRIDAAFPSNFENSRAEYVLIISCPDLKKVTTDARYMAGDLPVTDTLASAEFNWRPTIIRGFKLDSLSIKEDHASFIILSGNNIGTINSVIGVSKGSRSNLIISKDNIFKNASLDILNKSQLLLHNAAISNLQYQLADSARLILNGSSKNLLIKK